MAPVFFDTALAFRAWLERNHAVATELVVGFRKVDSGLPSLTWPESVDEALCFGWIDGVRKRIDEQTYLIRFTPRRRASNWSLVNVANVRRLAAEGRMHAAGLAAFDARSERRTGIYAFERPDPASLDRDEIRAFKRHGIAWQFFSAAPPSYRRVITHWVVSAKKPATRARRLAELVAACAEGRRLLK